MNHKVDDVNQINKKCETKIKQNKTHHEQNQTFEL